MPPRNLIKEPSRAELEEMASSLYKPGSSALRTIQAKMASRANGDAWILADATYEADRTKPLMRRADGSIAIPGFLASEHGREPFAAIAAQMGSGWSISKAIVPGKDGREPDVVSENHGVDWTEAIERPQTKQQLEAERAQDDLKIAKSAISEAKRLGARPGDEVLNKVHGTQIGVMALAEDAAKNAGADRVAKDASDAKAKAPAPKRGIEGAILRADPGAIVEARGRKMLRITVSTPAIAEAIDPTKIATSDSAKLLKAASGAARLPNGNLAMGAGDALASVAEGLDRRLPAHQVHLDLEELQKHIRKIGKGPGEEDPMALISGALGESRRESIGMAMRAMVPGKPGLGL